MPSRTSVLTGLQLFRSSPLGTAAQSLADSLLAEASAKVSRSALVDGSEHASSAVERPSNGRMRRVLFTESRYRL